MGIDYDSSAAKRGAEVLARQPLSAAIRIEITALSREGACFEVPITSSILQQDGFVSGGVVGYLADTALAFAGREWLGGRVVTSEYKTNRRGRPSVSA